jgi:hypothetical protein
MHFGTKSYLKSTRNHTAKHALRKRWHGDGGKTIPNKVMAAEMGNDKFS